MPPRALLPLLLVPVLAACGASPGAASSGASPAAERTVSLDWLKDRPSTTPWGPKEIPASRKPHWFCLSDIPHPESSRCAKARDACEPVPGQEKCEPHAKAACSDSLGACYPTIAICESVRRAAATDRAQGRARSELAGTDCAWRD